MILNCPYVYLCVSPATELQPAQSVTRLSPYGRYSFNLDIHVLTLQYVPIKMWIYEQLFPGFFPSQTPQAEITLVN